MELASGTPESACGNELMYAMYVRNSSDKD